MAKTSSLSKNGDRTPDFPHEGEGVVVLRNQSTSFCRPFVYPKTQEGSLRCLVVDVSVPWDLRENPFWTGWRLERGLVSGPFLEGVRNLRGTQTPGVDEV